MQHASHHLFPLSAHCLILNNVLVAETLDIERLLRHWSFPTAKVILGHATCTIVEVRDITKGRCRSLVVASDLCINMPITRRSSHRQAAKAELRTIAEGPDENGRMPTIPLQWQVTSHVVISPPTSESAASFGTTCCTWKVIVKERLELT
jgi:hypothetical protein